MALTSQLEWILEDPRRAFDRLASESVAPSASFLILFSAIVSFAAADAWMVPATGRALPWTSLLYLADAALGVFLFSRLSRLWKVPKVAFRVWWRSGVVAVAPLHLALPAAFLLRPWGTTGFVLYEIFKLFVLAWILRRWVWAVEALNGWPAWASALLVVSPFVLGLGFLIAGALLGIGAVAVALLGFLK